MTTKNAMAANAFVCPQCSEPVDPARGVGEYGVAGVDAAGIPYSRGLGIRVQCRNAHLWEAPGKTMRDLWTALSDKDGKVT